MRPARFMDGELVYGITGKSLNDKVPGAEVPSEPQYVLLNTAVSSTWGFPSPCPKNCDCACFDCRDASGRCACGLPPGFCATLPAHFLVDYVRVWQRPAEPWHKVMVVVLVLVLSCS